MWARAKVDVEADSGDVVPAGSQGLLVNWPPHSTDGKYEFRFGLSHSRKGGGVDFYPARLGPDEFEIV